MKFQALSIISLAASLVAGQSFCSNSSHSGQSVRITSNQVGNIGNIGYELWADSGSNSATFYSDGSFSCTFQNAKDYLCRTGLSFDSTKTHSQIGHLYADFKLVKQNIQNVDYSYVGIYGWSRNPLVEYYIVDNWLSQWRPGDWVGNKKHGDFMIDGAYYTVYENTRYNAPSIDGNTTFKQFFSIRQQARDCGTIDITAHFQQWEKLGMTLGNLHEAKVLGEAGSNSSGTSGTADFPYAKVYVGNGGGSYGGYTTTNQYSGSKTMPNTSRSKTLPYSTTSYSRSKTLPNSTTSYNRSKTLPNSSTTTYRSKTLPNSSTTTSRVKTLPNSSTTTYRSKTLPNSSTTTSRVKTLPNSSTTTSRSKTLPNSSTTTSRSKTIPGATTTTSRSKTIPGATTTTSRSKTIPGATTTTSRSKTIPGATTTTSRSKTIPGATTTTTSRSKTIPGGTTTTTTRTKTIPGVTVTTTTTRTKTIPGVTVTTTASTKTIPNNSTCKPVTVTVYQTVHDTVTVTVGGNSQPTWGNGGNYGGNCSAQWGQCGGIGWNGPTCCQQGSQCKYISDWYSQCV